MTLIAGNITVLICIRVLAWIINTILIILSAPNYALHRVIANMNTVVRNITARNIQAAMTKTIILILAEVIVIVLNTAKIHLSARKNTVLFTDRAREANISIVMWNALKFVGVRGTAR